MTREEITAYMKEWLKDECLDSKERATLIGALEELKTKTGHWVFDKTLNTHYYCSECKAMGAHYWDFCPCCGAKMEEV